MIRCEGVTYAYPRTGGGFGLSGVSLEARPGQITGLLGPNGSGKSTLLALLAGLRPGYAGTVDICGRNLRGYAPRELAQTLAMVPQRADLPPELPGLSLVLLGRYARLSALAGLGRGFGPRDHAAAQAAMDAAGCARLATRRVGGLSGGERKRLLLARALVQESRVLLLDELSAGLDPAACRETFDLLRRRAAAGLTVLAALHDLNLAGLYCDRLILLSRGTVLAQGPTAQVFREDALTEMYATELCMAAHPRCGAPQAHLVPGSAGAAGGRDPA